jgi:Ca2+-binding RTX toxin-like protein
MGKGIGKTMRRAGLVLVMMVVALVVGSGVAVAAVKYGTNGSDYLLGTNEEDVLYGGGGSDFLAGREEDDVLHGEYGDDFMHGGRVGWGMAPDGEDKLFGGKGSDCMFGGSEDDVLHGGSGSDDMGHYCYEFIFDTGNDVFYGGGGNDDITALEDHPQNTEAQERDVVFCGDGEDMVYYQKGMDRLFDCERKNPF